MHIRHLSLHTESVCTGSCTWQSTNFNVHRISEYLFDKPNMSFNSTLLSYHLYSVFILLGHSIPRCFCSFLKYSGAHNIPCTQLSLYYLWYALTPCYSLFILIRTSKNIFVILFSVHVPFKFTYTRVRLTCLFPLLFTTEYLIFIFNLFHLRMLVPGIRRAGVSGYTWDANRVVISLGLCRSSWILGDYYFRVRGLVLIYPGRIKAYCQWFSNFKFVKLTFS